MITEQDKVIVLEAINKLWFSKGRICQPEVAVYWMERMLEEWCPEWCVTVMNDMVMDDNDWPTLGKVRVRLAQLVDENQLDATKQVEYIRSLQIGVQKTSGDNEAVRKIANNVL